MTRQETVTYFPPSYATLPQLHLTPGGGFFRPGAPRHTSFFQVTEGKKRGKGEAVSTPQRATPQVLTRPTDPDEQLYWLNLRTHRTMELRLERPFDRAVGVEVPRTIVTSVSPTGCCHSSLFSSFFLFVLRTKALRHVPRIGE